MCILDPWSSTVDYMHIGILICIQIRVRFLKRTNQRVTKCFLENGTAGMGHCHKNKEEANDKRLSIAKSR